MALIAEFSAFFVFS